ncbi:hypothetical protein ACFQH6_11480 [Halobacteriaceae archaeon GCM10025711]
MSQQLPEEWFVKDARINATVAWLMTVLLVVAAVLNFFNGLLVATATAGTAAFVAIVPAAMSRNWKHTIPWPLLLLASIPYLLTGAQVGFFGDFVIGIGTATLALLVVVALQLTTTVRMTPGFAVFFTAIATMAVAGFWAVGSAASAAMLGTSFVETNDQLMYIFSAATLAGVVMGLVFRWYFRRRLARDAERLAAGEVEFA